MYCVQFQTGNYPKIKAREYHDHWCADIFEYSRARSEACMYKTYAEAEKNAQAFSNYFNNKDFTVIDATNGIAYAVWSNGTVKKQIRKAPSEYENIFTADWD